MPVELAGQRGRIIDRLHAGLQDRRIGHAHDFEIEQMAERPARVVVRMLLRIVGRPELPIEQRIGDARIGLIHAHHDAARGNVSGFGLSPRFSPATSHVAASESCCISTCWRLSTFSNSTSRFVAAASGRDHIGRGPFQRRLLNRALALHVVVLEKVMRVLREVRDRRSAAPLSS